MELNPASFLNLPAALAVSLSEFNVARDHKTIVALHHDIESRSLAAIDEKYSAFKVSSSWTTPDSQRFPESLRQHLGADDLSELTRSGPEAAVINIGSVICMIYRRRGRSSAHFSELTKPSNKELRDICRWYAPADANRLVEAVRNYVEERAGQQVRLRSDWTRTMVDFFPMMTDESTVLGRVNGQGVPQTIPRARIPYLALRDRINWEGGREVIAVFEDGSNDILTNLKIRRAPNQSQNEWGALAVPQYAETRTGLPGRPSRAPLIKAVLAERIAANVICERIGDEAKALMPIVASRLRPEDGKPCLKGIESTIRKTFHEAIRSRKGNP